MVHHNINTLLKEANSDLAASENELSRPYEDVVVLSACQSTRRSIRKLLTTMIGYNYSLTYIQLPNLEKKLLQLESWSLYRLIEKSAKLYPALSQLDYTVLACQADAETGEPHYCTNEEKVEECTKLGRKIEFLVSKYIATQEAALKTRRNKKLN